MPIICRFRGIRIYLNYSEHLPPHFQAQYGEYDWSIAEDDIDLLTGSMPNKQLKMLLGWAALHQEELTEEWCLAQHKQELFPIEPLR